MCWRMGWHQGVNPLLELRREQHMRSFYHNYLQFSTRPRMLLLYAHAKVATIKLEMKPNSSYETSLGHGHNPFLSWSQVPFSR